MPKPELVEGVLCECGLNDTVALMIKFNSDDQGAGVMWCACGKVAVFTGNWKEVYSFKDEE